MSEEETVQEEPTVGRGYFTMSAGLMQALEIELPVPTSGTAPYASVEAAFDELHKQMLFPETLKIAGVFHSIMARSYMVVLEGDPIPVRPEAADLPRLDLTYNVENEGEVRSAKLLKIEAVWTEQHTAEVYVAG